MIRDYILWGPFRKILVWVVDYLPENLEEWLLYQLYPNDATITFFGDEEY